jgi:hypothetical protein
MDSSSKVAEQPPIWIAGIVNRLVPRSRRAQYSLDRAEDYTSVLVHLETAVWDIVYANLSCVRRYIHTSRHLRPRRLGLAITLIGLIGALLDAPRSGEAPGSRGLDFFLGAILAASTVYWLTMPTRRSDRTTVVFLLILLCQVSLVLLSAFRSDVIGYVRAWTTFLSLASVGIAKIHHWWSPQYET